jgi:hypothetical protein
MAKAKSLENEPPGYKPSDMIDSAESILCLGIPVPKGIFQCKERSEWIDALGLEHELTPPLGKCMKVLGKECSYKITLRFP